MKHSLTKTILLLIMAFILTTGFLPVKNYKCIATDSHKAGFVIEKLFTETTVHYDKAKRNNRELVRVIICATDAQGNLYAGFGPGNAELFTNVWPNVASQEHVKINQFVVQGTNGYYGIWLEPGTTDKWRKGVYVLGYRIKNATHQCAGMIRLKF